MIVDDPLVGGAALSVMSAMAVVITKYGYELVKNVKSNGNGNGQSHRWQCLMAGPDFAKMRTVDIAERVVQELEPMLQQQLDVLKDIREDLRRRRNG